MEDLLERPKPGVVRGAEKSYNSTRCQDPSCQNLAKFGSGLGGESEKQAEINLDEGENGDTIAVGEGVKCEGFIRRYKRKLFGSFGTGSSEPNF